VSENNPMRRVWSVISLTDDCDQAITRVPNWHTFFLGVDQYVHYRSWAASCAVSAESTGNHVITVNCVSYNPGATIQEERTEEEAMSDRDGNSFVWFLAGLGIGAVVGVLYAPRPGEETREVLLSKAQEGRERVRQQTRKAREQAGDWMERGRDVVGQQKEQFRAAYEAGRQAYRETTSAGTEPPSGV
jgi:gas vesicle protein